MTHARHHIPHVVAITSVMLCAQLFAADPGLETLDSRLTKIVRTARGQVGVSLFHVESGARLFSFNGRQPFAMASVYKLPIAFELLTQIAKRRLTFDQLVVVGPSDIRACCTLSRRHPNGGITMTVGRTRLWARSLRVQFDGTENVTRTGLQETVVLKPGRYRFRAWVRARDLSTDEGVALHVEGQDGPGPNFTSEAVTGSTEWKLVERELVAPAGTGLVTIRLARKASLKFDNLLKGTLWVDDVSIQPEN